MKFHALAAVAVVCLLTAGNVFAGEPSRAALGKMGLAGLKPMTTSEGMQVRGMGSFAFVGGFSHSSLTGGSSIGGTSQTNIYAAGASHMSGSSLAAGASISVSGAGGNTPFGSGFLVVGSLGGAVAFAH